MEQTSLPVIVLGFLLGMKHSLDIDHLAAVTTLIANQRNRWKSALVGTYWGMGHSASLMGLGGVIILFDVKFPPAVSLVLEFGVGLMLIALGLRVLLRLRKGGTLHLHAHEHAGRLHVHPHLHEGGVLHAHDPAAGHHIVRLKRPRSPKTSLLVGVFHGLAGSAGLTLVLLPSIPTRLMGIVYLALFGAGSVLGMTLATYLVSIPLGRIGPGGRTARVVSICAGCLSLLVGLMLMMETGAAIVDAAGIEPAAFAL